MCWGGLAESLSLCSCTNASSFFLLQSHSVPSAGSRKVSTQILHHAAGRGGEGMQVAVALGETDGEGQLESV